MSIPERIPLSTQLPASSNLGGLPPDMRGAIPCSPYVIRRKASSSGSPFNTPPRREPCLHTGAFVRFCHILKAITHLRKLSPGVYLGGSSNLLLFFYVMEANSPSGSYEGLPKYLYGYSSSGDEESRAELF